MKFLYYCSDFELSLKYDDMYDYSKGIICRIDNLTHLAVAMPILNTKKTIIYAVFDWSEMDYDSKEYNIQKAENISPSIIQFVNSTIEHSQNRIMPLHQKESIKSALKYSQVTPLGNFKSEQHGIHINMIETGTPQESTWTIYINGNGFTTLNNKRAADLVFKSLCESINQYIKAWAASLKK